MKHFLLCSFLLTLLPSIFATVQKIPEKKIFLIIPSYNNPINYTRECLISALAQDYSNFEIIFSDDCSPQENIEQIHMQLIQELDTHKRITYRHNTKRLGPLGNRWNAIHSINPDNILDNRDIIIANVDGDDILLRNDALTIINELHENAWTTFGTYSILPSRNAYCACRAVDSLVVAENSWRLCTVSLSHMQTYRLSLLKDLPLYTYLWNGNFYPAATDLQSIWGCCEKSQFKTAFNPIPIYGYRLHQNNEMHTKEGTLGAACLAHARAQEPFQPLQELPLQRPLDSYHCDLIIFSNDNPHELSIQLRSLKTDLPDIHSVFIFYNLTKASESHYNILKYNHPHYHFLQISHQADLKPLLNYCFTESSSEYVLFLKNNTSTHYVPLKDCIRALLKTHAHIFYTQLSHLPTQMKIEIGNDVVAWDFATITDPKLQTNHSMMKFFNLTIFSKKTLHKAIASMGVITVDSFENQWNNYSRSLRHNIGLCFDFE